MHHQDPALNLTHGQRDYIRTRAQERAMSAGKRGRYNTFGNIGMVGLRARPDLRVDKRGLFEKEPMQLHVKGKVRDVSNDNLMLAKKYRDMEKENHLRKLRRGLTDENFKADKAWRPGG